MSSSVDGRAATAATPDVAASSTRLSFLRRHWPLWVALAVVLAGRVALLDWTFSPDESGFYMVADDLLHHGGDGLYGHYWVDRPPLLIWIFMIAAGVGDIAAVRWLVALFLLGFVVLAYLASRRLGGSGGWAAAVAAAFTITPEVGAQLANGEAFAIPFVLASVLCTAVSLSHGGRRALLWSFAAGLLGLLAMAVKQNFVDGLVFALVLLVASGLRGELPWPDVVRRLVAGVVGIVAGTAVMVAYALTTGAGIAGLWLASVSFRGDASRVIRAGYRTGIESREDAMVVSALVTGIVPLVLALLLVALLAKLRGGAIAWALAVTVGVETLSIVVGGNYWDHYLLGLAPGLALAVGWVAGHRPGEDRTPVSLSRARVVARWLVLPTAGYLVCSALVSMPLALAEQNSVTSVRSERLGGFVAASAEPGDTATTIFGRADIQFQSGLPSPYQHLWSLPIRVLDPDLVELTAILEGDDAPTWLMQVFSFHEWGLDPEGNIDPVLARRYELVYDDCASRVYKLRSAERDLAPLPTC
ncbi:hypothetical protein ncot_12200 [Nocardioides sp. JQ2195]|uniref:ArnT family glycosyltransferase n=1 Tax=Nocardioides sp. JQ2195 TaxID=2592334 RepID=UPI00143ECAA6|nr:hypothetical protein [Nocardioides sp. JQ2195]QIX27276.1 hypothetical protein ncot_12200 [Nocardioides sp. JQ2195]